MDSADYDAFRKIWKLLPDEEKMMFLNECSEEYKEKFPCHLRGKIIGYGSRRSSHEVHMCSFCTTVIEGDDLDDDYTCRHSRYCVDCKDKYSCKKCNKFECCIKEDEEQYSEENEHCPDTDCREILHQTTWNKFHCPKCGKDWDITDIDEAKFGRFTKSAV